MTRTAPDRRPPFQPTRHACPAPCHARPSCSVRRQLLTAAGAALILALGTGALPVLSLFLVRGAR
jgi:hypothetical protein